MKRIGAENGAAAMWMIVAISAVLLAMGPVIYSRLSIASDQNSDLQTAADAAALAGAQSIVKDAPNAIKYAVRGGGALPCGLGRQAAQSFADRNHASVTSYCYHPVSDRVEVTVRSNKVLETGARESATAVAELGVKLGPCRLPETPEFPTPSPPPTATGTATATTTPTPPPTPDDITEQGSCGDIIFDVIFPGSGEEPSFGWGNLKLDVEPKLRN